MPVSENRSSRVSVRVGLSGCVCRSRGAAREAGSGSGDGEEENAADREEGLHEEAGEQGNESKGLGGEHGAVSWGGAITRIATLERIERSSAVTTSGNVPHEC